MQVVDLQIENISAPEWNANEMDQEMQERLRRSIERFGLLVPLLVREIVPGSYETIGGAQRLAISRELGCSTVPCVVTYGNDAESRLLSQCLNHIAGQDNPGLRGEVLRRILESTSESEVAALIPGPWERLKELTKIGQEDLAEYLHSRLQTRNARLEHLVFQLSREQLELVRTALRRAGSAVLGPTEQNPNRRGNALAAICKKYLEEGDCNDQSAR